MHVADAERLLASVRRGIVSLQDVLDALEDGGSALPDEPEQEAPEALGPTHLVVGKDTGSPGELVTVDILGGSDQPVQGFGGNIGVPAKLELVGSKVSSELIALTGIKDPEDIASQGKFGGVGDYVSFFVAFFAQVTDVVPLDPDGPPPKVKRLIVETIIPPLTPLMSLTFRIPAGAKSKDRYQLLNESNKYGRPLGNGSGLIRRLTMHTVFATSREVSRHGIRPELVSGWVEVT